jgi:hypothetical protein
MPDEVVRNTYPHHYQLVSFYSPLVQSGLLFYNWEERKWELCEKKVECVFTSWPNWNNNNNKMDEKEYR